MKKINTVTTIPYTAAAAQALQVGHAGFVLLGPFGGLLGGILGVTITLSVTNASSRITEIAKGRRWLAYVGLVALLLVAPVMVGPSAFLSFGVIPEAWLRIVAAVAWAVAPDVCMILSGAIAGKGLVAKDAPVDATQSGANATAPKRKARRNATAWPRKCAQCGEVVPDAGRMGAHVRFMHPKPVPADSVFVGKK